MAPSCHFGDGVTFHSKRYPVHTPDSVNGVFRVLGAKARARFARIAVATAYYGNNYPGRCCFTKRRNGANHQQLARAAAEAQEARLMARPPWMPVSPWVIRIESSEPM